ncbi:early protein [Human papillomavirus type 7]|uniref:Protein E7 n=2 Tax=Human papillomavirus 7 TaxID=10620 RepID=VE7_HPV07|nr:early protein [Human papillomavirus type 7]P36816.1 RecName: Full=Protein E7 [Human papillomavirus type 7]QEE83788.1 E7 [Human papillomavirus type 7]QEE83795.1 E7 [Human papillomavirus type 7]QEE83802.1 E7 [Human papillomavirus type 7]QEE83809.1 E7 [Human papillomavirus type 7]CAA52477.1 early protein [Human papillomavirus type 7]
MHGERPTLGDIVLDLQPEPVSLSCNEQLDSSDSEDDHEQDQLDSSHNRQREQPTQQDLQVNLQSFKIVTHCVFCHCLVRLVVHCTATDIRQVHQLLMGTLNIVCPNCAATA